MIKSVLIKNFILIDELFLEFSDNFNVILGETGAGKSIIIKAIDVALGAKTSKDALKNDNNHALIELTFEQNGEEKIISREISKTGTKCRINGALVTLDEVREEKERLIDIHTQFQTYNYIQQKHHIELLDLYIKAQNSDYSSILAKQENEYKRYIEVKNSLKKIMAEAGSSTEKIEFLKFQTDEIERADIQENEEEELNRELEVLSNVQELKELSYGSWWAIGGDNGSIVEALSGIAHNISSMQEYDKNLASLEENFLGALETLKDCSYELRNYSESLENDPERLDFVSERLELIEKLKRKYGNIFESYKKFKAELETLENSTFKTKELEDEIIRLETSINDNTKKITALRLDYAKKLSKTITEELKNLEFSHPRFEIAVSPAQTNSKGADYVEFMLTVNLSKDLTPLAKSASGGEISRVMLALKTVFAGVDKVSTVIFDEIDTGISGKTGVSVAEAISNLAKTAQVFAITHQPIIASYAKSAFWVSKTQSENSTQVNVSKLDKEGKIKALAQMSSGVSDEKSISFAKELLQKVGCNA